MIARVVRAFLLVTAMLMHLAVPAHDGEHADDGSYLSHLPYDEVSADRLTLFRGMPVHREAVPMLRRMWRDTAKDDVFLVMTSGFRTIEQQARLFYRDASARSLEEIARTVAPPGHSEHHTGLAFDFDDGRNPANLDQSFEHTKAGRWLLKNAHRYGLHLSFPRNNLRNISYEPWHYFMKDLHDALARVPSTVPENAMVR